MTTPSTSGQGFVRSPLDGVEQRRGPRVGRDPGEVAADVRGRPGDRDGLDLAIGDPRRTGSFTAAASALAGSTVRVTIPTAIASHNRIDIPRRYACAGADATQARSGRADCPTRLDTATPRRGSIRGSNAREAIVAQVVTRYCCAIRASLPRTYPGPRLPKHRPESPAEGLKLSPAPGASAFLRIAHGPTHEELRRGESPAVLDRRIRACSDIEDRS